MHRQVIQDGVDSLHVFGNPLLHLLEKINPVDERSTGVGRGEYLAINWLQCSKDVACFATSSIVDRLFGSTCWLRLCRDRVDQMLARIAFDGLWSHFIQTYTHTPFGRSGGDRSDGSPFSGEVGIDPFAKPTFFMSPRESFGDEDFADAATLHTNAFDAMQVVYQPIQRPGRIGLSQGSGIGKSRLDNFAHHFRLLVHRTT